MPTKGKALYASNPTSDGWVKSKFFADAVAQATKGFEAFGDALRKASSNMVATTTPRESQDAIKLLREMLRQAERGEIVLCGLSIQNQQPDRWDSSGGMERLRLDNRYKVTLEMRAYDRRAATQPPPQAVLVDVDKAALEVLTKPTVDYITMQGDDPRTSYRLPVQPVKTLAERIVETNIRHGADYRVLRIGYDTRDRLILEGILEPQSMLESPVKFLGMDLIVEAPDGRTRAQADEAVPTFDDGLDERDWNEVTPNGAVSTRRRTVNESFTTEDRYVTGNGNVTRGVTTTRKPAEKPKAKTPAGASAAREIIFDD